VVGFNLNEIAKRLCFDCSVFAKLLADVLSMLRISCAMTNNFYCHANQFICLISQGKKVNDCFHAI